MTFRDIVKACHPDANGGDTSRVAELQAAIEERDQLCRCGCGAKRPSNRTKYLNQLHFVRHRFYARSLAGFALALLLCGCRVTPPRSTALPSMPPKPVAVLHSPKAAGEQVRLRAVVVPVPQTFTLTWTQPCDPALRPFIEAAVYLSYDMRNWVAMQTLPVESEELSTVVTAVGDHAFWTVRWWWKP